VKASLLVLTEENKVVFADLIDRLPNLGQSFEVKTKNGPINAHVVDFLAPEFDGQLPTIVAKVDSADVCTEK